VISAMKNLKRSRNSRLEPRQTSLQTLQPNAIKDSSAGGESLFVKCMTHDKQDTRLDNKIRVMVLQKSATAFKTYST